MLKYYYRFSNEELFNMSLYNTQNYIDNIPLVLGQEEKKETIDNTKMEDGRELVEQARRLGLPTPRNF